MTPWGLPPSFPLSTTDAQVGMHKPGGRGGPPPMHKWSVADGNPTLDQPAQTFLLTPNWQLEIFEKEMLLLLIYACNPT